MGNYKLINILAITFIVFSGSVSYAEESSKASEMERNISYFYGYTLGNNLTRGGISEINMEEMTKGVEDALSGKMPSIPEAMQKEVIAEIQNRQKAVEEKRLGEGLAMARNYLSDSAKEEGVKTTESGLQYKVLVEGEGDSPVATNRVKVHYVGRLVNGVEFDSSIKRGEPAEFGLNQVIPGWTEGVQLMKVGSKYKFIIPPELGYGAGGTRGIPPNSVLVFEVELLEIVS